MKPEYQRIVCEEWENYFGSIESPKYLATRVAERCEALANKRELTDDECNKIWTESPDFGDMSKLVRWIVKEYVAKQSEPDEIPFDQKKLDDGGWAVKRYIGDNSVVFEADKVTLVRKP